MPTDQKDNELLENQGSTLNQDSQKKDVVDAWFWLKWAKESVEQTPARIDAELKSVQSVVGWTFTAQVVTGVLGFSFAGLSSWVYILLLSLPLPFLIVAYFFSYSKARIELADGMDPRVPDEARSAYNNILNDKIYNLKVAKGCAAAGFAVLFVSLLLSSFIKYAPVFFTKENFFSASLHTNQNGRVEKQISVTGHLPPKDTLVFYIESYHVPAAKLGDSTRPQGLEKKIDVKYYENSNSGDFLLSFPVDPKAVKYSIRIEWRDENVFRSLRKELELKTPEKDSIDVKNPGTLKDPPADLPDVIQQILSANNNG